MLKKILDSTFILLCVAVWVLAYSGNVYGQSSPTLSPWLSLFNNNRGEVLDNCNKFTKPKQEMLRTLQDRSNQLVPEPAETSSFRDIPKETAKSLSPDYLLESPDIITVESVYLVPKLPYVLRAFDVIALDVTGTSGGTLIIGTFFVEPDGTIQLGEVYGSVQVKGLSLAEVEQAVSQHLSRNTETETKNTTENTSGQSGLNTVVSAKLVRIADVHQIANSHLIGPDGYITLGSYGRVYVNGLTIDECRKAIEVHLSKAFEHPQVTVDVYSYNSKEYYVVFQSAMGKQVIIFPYTGNETVLTAISNINGLRPNLSKRIWVTRQVENSQKPKILPVDWVAVTAYGMPQTNYQLLPGDRVYLTDEMLARTSRVNKDTTVRHRRPILWKSKSKTKSLDRQWMK
ncbi:MAG: polysaccharide biosynthesis/export family protein [Planctomycetaceae bacterium]|jgi:polysaccharide export outer membrane protein|nr:polysaccharide biosynthesis/export family protein [Planctomycetaceae bacterium]